MGDSLDNSLSLLHLTSPFFPIRTCIILLALRVKSSPSDSRNFWSRLSDFTSDGLNTIAAFVSAAVDCFDTVMIRIARSFFVWLSTIIADWILYPFCCYKLVIESLALFTPDYSCKNYVFCIIILVSDYVQIVTLIPLISLLTIMNKADLSSLDSECKKLIWFLYLFQIKNSIMFLR